MAHDYLSEFRARIASLHDPPRTTCHWSNQEEFTTPNLKKTKGPCDCPRESPKGDECAPHNAFLCASTEKVLSTPTSSETHYAPMLKELATHMESLEDAIKSGREAIANMVAGGMSRAAAMQSFVFGDIMHGHWVSDSMDFESILLMPIDQSFSKDPLPPSVDCRCELNKEWRLLQEKELIITSREQAAKQSAALTAAYNDGSATFENSLGVVMSASWGIVTGVMAGAVVLAPTTILSEIGILMKYYNTYYSSRGVIEFTIYNLVHDLGELKKDAMLAIIYHDQQLKAQTCLVYDLPERKISLPPPPPPPPPSSPTSEGESNEAAQDDPVMHRGRLQVQGDDMKPELSWPWARTKSQGPLPGDLALQQLAILRGKCNKKQLAQRDQAFKKAQRFIENAMKTGGIQTPPKVQKTFQNSPPPDPKNARVDIEVWEGTAFTK